MTESGKMWTKYDEKINDQLKPYIFNEDEVLESVPFVQFKSKRGKRFCFGLIIPKFHIDDKTGEEHQLMKPVILSSYSGEQVPILQEIRRNENQPLGVRFEGIPASLPKRYSLNIVPKWLHRQAPEVSFEEVFKTIREAYEQYIFCPDIWYDIHACWDIATYFFTLFNAFPYIELRGIKGSAKTKVMRVSRCFSFNPSRILTSPTEASLFRLVNDARPTLYLDECENLFRVVKGKVEHDDRIEVLNSGYDKEGVVPRVEKIGSKFVTMHYATYCPKMLASINGLHGATEDRSLIHIMTRAPDNDARGEREIDSSNKKWQDLRDSLFFLALSRWEEVETIGSEVRSQELGIKKRNHQLWTPVLTIARLIDEEVYQRILSYAQKQQELSRADDLGENSWEMIALKRMYELVQSGERVILLKDLSEAIPEESRPRDNRTLARALDKLGLRDKKGHSRDGTTYEISGVAELNVILGGVSNNILSSLSSLASPEVNSASFSVTEVKMCEDKPENVKINCDDNDAVTLMKMQTIRKAQDIMQDLSKISPKTLTFEELLSKCQEENSEEWLRITLQTLKQRGDIYEPKPNQYGVLQ